jgi:hypothetical protein
VVDDLEKLRTELRAMRVPEPRRGFEDRVLANATGSPARAPRGFRAALRRPSTWWAAAAGALAATLAWVAVLWMQPGVAPEASLIMALNETREVPLVIESERDLEGATIRLYVMGSVALAGYEQQREVKWVATLTQGANLLSLPVVAREPGEGRVVAEIEHEGRTRRVSVAMHVSTPARAKDDTA